MNKAAAVILVLPLSGFVCAPIEPGPPNPPDNPIIDDDDDDNPLPDDPLAAIEDALFDYLQCEEHLRPSTIERIRDVLRDPTFDEARALLLAPQDLATVVALGGSQVEASVILARNLLRLVETGAAKDLVENGWDGVSCGEPVTVLCTAGEQTTTVTCASNEPASVTVTYSGCTLDGTVHDGAAIFVREIDDLAATLTFDGLTFNEIKELDGGLTVDVGAGPAAFSASLANAQAFTVLEHGGLSSSVSCAAELSVSAAVIDVVDNSAHFELAARHENKDRAVGVETFGQHLEFDVDAACGCPLPGSGIAIDVPRPLGQDGQTARARVSFVSTSDASLCAAANVELVDWPTSCNASEDVNGDCAKGATQDTLSKLLTAMCAL